MFLRVCSFTETEDTAELIWKALGYQEENLVAQSAAEMETLGNSNINCEKGAAPALSLIRRHIFSAC